MIPTQSPPESVLRLAQRRMPELARVVPPALAGCAALLAAWLLSAAIWNDADRDPYGRLYVANLGSSTVTALDLSGDLLSGSAGGEPSASWAVARNPHEFVQTDEALYVSNYRADAISSWSLSNEGPLDGAGAVGVQATPERPHGLAVDGRGDVWYTSADGAIHRLSDARSSGEGGEVSIVVGETPHAIVIDAARDRAYVAVAGTGEVVLVDLRARSVLARSEAGAVAESVAVSRDGGTVAVAAAEAGLVSVYEAEDLSLRYQIRTPGRPVRVVLTGEALLVSLSIEGALAIYDLESGTLRALLAVGDLADGIAVDDEERYAYVAATGSDRISVVDLRRATVVGSIETGERPSGVQWTAGAP